MTAEGGGRESGGEGGGRAGSGRREVSRCGAQQSDTLTPAERGHRGEAGHDLQDQICPNTFLCFVRTAKSIWNPFILAAVLDYTAS